MKKFAVVIIILAFLAGAGYLTRRYWVKTGSKAVEAIKECYTCPMHPQIVREKPGECPICGMNLVKKTVTEGGNMPEEKPEADTGELRTVTLDPRERMLANVATTEVKRGGMSQDVYTVGKIAYNEQSVQKISARYAGRIERLGVNFTGQYVKKGQELFSIYSPDVVATEKEYLIAKQSAGRLGASGFPEISRAGEGMLEAARTRLKLWGLADVQIDRLDKTGEVSPVVSVYSPISGTVTEIKARAGDYVMEGGEVYTVSDLSKVWMLAEVYEYEFSKVSLGSAVEVTAEAYTGRTFHGKVVFISPSVNPDSRTVEVRADLPNPGGMLKPEMFVNARIFSKPLQGLMVPASAILYTGRGDVAWVEESTGVFAMREVKTGMRSGDDYEVLSGLKEGEKVVTQGGFLIDSEAQLRASGGGTMAGMAGMEMGGGKEKAAPAKPGTAAPEKGMKGMPGM